MRIPLLSRQAGPCTLWCGFLNFNGMTKHISLRVSGKVQGVFFRASTHQKALELSLKGFVRNEPDGSVYIEAEGQENNLALFKEWCSHGPRSARVNNIDILESTCKGFADFSIK
jgi:acylphosphatase